MRLESEFVDERGAQIDVLRSFNRVGEEVEAHGQRCVSVSRVSHADRLRDEEELPSLDIASGDDPTTFSSELDDLNGSNKVGEVQPLARIRLGRLVKLHHVVRTSGLFSKSIFRLSQTDGGLDRIWIRGEELGKSISGLRPLSEGVKCGASTMMTLFAKGEDLLGGKGAGPVEELEGSG